MPDTISVKRALISTYDKSGITGLAQVLIRYGVEIIATGGTAALLREHNIPITEIADVTGFPEMLGGRVKTLHPVIHAGILARRGIDDNTLAEHAIKPIDLVVINLYPFEEAASTPNATIQSVIEQIDIGGPTMLRAAAKNSQSVTALSSPDSYADFIQEMDTHKGAISESFRQQQAAGVFALTAHYNQAIAQYFKHSILAEKTNQKTLRYGENPNQTAICRVNDDASDSDLAACIPLQGKALSYNNLVDADAAWNTACAFPSDKPTCCIVKHATPCGIASGTSMLNAYKLAWETDSTSAFGGIIACNQSVDAQTATAITQQFVEVILAPSFDADALVILQKKPSIRVMQLNPASVQTELKSIAGGRLEQSPLPIDPAAEQTEWTIPTKRKPTEQEMNDMIFAWRAIKNVKSNAIFIAKNEQAIGIGSGQTSRVFAATIAILKAQEAQLPTQGAVAASDAFFPFADGLQVLADAGITAIIQPGGSKRDPEVIAAADTANIALVHTGSRLFKH